MTLNILTTLAKEDQKTAAVKGYEYKKVLDYIIDTLGKLSGDTDVRFSPEFRKVIWEGLPWDIKFFKEYSRLIEIDDQS